MSLNQWYCFPMNSAGDFETARCHSSLELRAHQLHAVWVKALCWAFTTGWSLPQACRLVQPKLSSFAALTLLQYLYCWQAPTHVLENLASTTRVGGIFFLLQWCWFFHKMWENSSILPDTYSLEGKVIWVMSSTVSGLSDQITQN